jgi:hypothetical protein
MIKIYVAPNGNDNNSGLHSEDTESDGPLSSLGKALLLLAKMKDEGFLQGEAQIILRGGTYQLDKPICINEDIHYQACIRAHEGERVVLSGGQKISGWREQVVNGLRVWDVELDEVKNGHWYFKSLFVNEKRRDRPRLPKKGLSRLSEVPGMPKHNTWSNVGYDRFCLGEIDINDFKNKSDIEVIVPHFWICERLPIAHYDEDSKCVTTKTKSLAPLVEAWGEKLAPYYLDNVKETLSEPGEWYLSREDGILTYLPLEGEYLNEVTIVAPHLLQLLKIKGSPKKQQRPQGLRFQNIEFRYTDWAQPHEENVEKDTPYYDPNRSISKYSRHERASAAQADCDISGAIYLYDTRDVTFENCIIANTGWYGVDISDGCRQIHLKGCTIEDIGGGGVKINGMSYDDHLPALETGKIEISDCHIHHGGRVFCASVAIHSMHSYENTIRHNHIHDFFYSGISLGWQWEFKPSVSCNHLVEFNHIHHLGAGLLSDMGGIYTLGLQCGTVLRNNYIHHIEALNYGAWCIYTDEGTSHILIENNICHSTNREIFHQHYGRENIVRNNIFAFGGRALIAYACFVKPHIGFRLYRNILVTWDNDHYLAGYDVNLTDLGHESDFNLLFRYDNEALTFSKKEHTTSLEDDEKISLEQWQKVGHDTSSIFEDPLFVDAENFNFELKPESPAIKKLGFKPIEMSRIGPRDKSSWAVKWRPRHFRDVR